MYKEICMVGGEPVVSVFFFFQAEDGMRDVAVTGVQTCALPISPVSSAVSAAARRERVSDGATTSSMKPSRVAAAAVRCSDAYSRASRSRAEIGRAAGRERG